jgi:uncharacterized protein YfkK (UPF0435 family)
MRQDDIKGMLFNVKTIDGEGEIDLNYVFDFMKSKSNFINKLIDVRDKKIENIK